MVAQRMERTIGVGGNTGRRQGNQGTQRRTYALAGNALDLLWRDVYMGRRCRIEFVGIHDHLCLHCPCRQLEVQSKWNSRIRHILCRGGKAGGQRGNPVGARTQLQKEEGAIGAGGRTPLGLSADVSSSNGCSRQGRSRSICHEAGESAGSAALGDQRGSTACNQSGGKSQGAEWHSRPLRKRSGESMF